MPGARGCMETGMKMRKPWRYLLVEVADSPGALLQHSVGHEVRHPRAGHPRVDVQVAPQIWPLVGRSPRNVW
eukprot:6646997-Pyramimonas_sp.AAC.1